ncbi:hypothetical protein ACIBL8_42780 [Streptomyces sp. NPDC050523]|uniref:hypothetical protein n=1 Tax=Streptomyces sp. NPDC050523 TaxID=3365622 RepID=UPI00379B3EEF
MDANKEAARGLNAIENYLYQEAHLSGAHQRVEEFTAQEEGLTHGQKAAIERWYLEEQAYVARMVTAHIAARIGEVEQQHRAHLGRWLRGTLIGMAVITAALITTCVTVILAVSR